MTARNINGTTDSHCKCGSWLNHWRKFSGGTALYCSEKNCVENYSLVGAHVQKPAPDKNWYIIPLCLSHNSSITDLEVSNTTIFVPANKSETCEK